MSSIQMGLINLKVCLLCYELKTNFIVLSAFCYVIIFDFDILLINKIILKLRILSTPSKYNIYFYFSNKYIVHNSRCYTYKYIIIFSQYITGFYKINRYFLTEFFDFTLLLYNMYILYSL